MNKRNLVCMAMTNLTDIIGFHVKCNLHFKLRPSYTCVYNGLRFKQLMAKVITYLITISFSRFRTQYLNKVYVFRFIILSQNQPVSLARRY